MPHVDTETFVVGPLETNCYVVFGEEKKAVVIDPGFYDERISRFIREKKLDIQYIINTHGHPDHVASNAKFDAPVLIHELDMHFLKSAAGILKDKDKIAVDGFSFEVIHTPGHTPGSICLKVGKVLFTGDTLFCEGIGRADLPYSDAGTLMRSIREKLMKLEDDVLIYPGHGPSSTIGNERKYNPFL